MTTIIRVFLINLQFEDSFGDSTSLQLLDGQLVVFQSESADSQAVVLKIPKTGE